MAFLAPLALGTAATAATATTAATAATAGLFGVGGAFSLGTTLGTLGTFTSLLGGIQQGQAAEASAKYNASVARENAKQAEIQTQQELEQQDRDRRLRIGANIAGAGASGLTVGSFGDILQQNAALEELDVMNIKQQGALRRAGFVNEANLRSAEAASTSRAGIIGAASKLLSGSARFF